MIDLSAVEQLLEVGQLRAIVQVMESLHDDTKGQEMLWRQGQDSCLRWSLRQVVDNLDAEVEKIGIIQLHEIGGGSLRPPSSPKDKAWSAYSGGAI